MLCAITMNNLNTKISSPFSKTMIGEGSAGTDTQLNLEPYLMILSGSDRGKQFKLQQACNIFGRHIEADIMINDPKISRKHGVLTVSQEGVLLEDLQSTNGIFVGGKRISQQWLTVQDRIHVGDTILRIDYKCRNEAASVQALYQAAYTDELTGILNRGAFMLRAQEEFSFCKRNNALLSIVMCDVDHFKRKNDSFGHMAGDHILRELSAILAAQMRREDLLARYGGEEFIMLLRETPEAAAEAWADRVRQTVMTHAFLYLDQIIPTTISIGLCTRRISPIDTLAGVIRLADTALYQAKQNGRNRLELAHVGMDI